MFTMCCDGLLSQNRMHDNLVSILFSIESFMFHFVTLRARLFSRHFDQDDRKYHIASAWLTTRIEIYRVAEIAFTDAITFLFSWHKRSTAHSWISDSIIQRQTPKQLKQTEIEGRLECWLQIGIVCASLISPHKLCIGGSLAAAGHLASRSNSFTDATIRWLPFVNINFELPSQQHFNGLTSESPRKWIQKIKSFRHSYIPSNSLSIKLSTFNLKSCSLILVACFAFLSLWKTFN